LYDSAQQGAYYDIVGLLNLGLYFFDPPVDWLWSKAVFFVTFVSESLPDFSMVSAIARVNATHVNETVADTTIQSFLTKNNAVNKNSQGKHSG
jgi:hypothetical protein